MKKLIITLLWVLVFFGNYDPTLAEGVSSLTSEADIEKLRLVDVLNTYAELSNKDVDIVAGIFSPRITIRIGQIPIEEQLKLIERKLAENGIGIFEIGGNRVMVTWLEPVAGPARKFLNYCKKNKITSDMAPVEVNTRLTPRLLSLKEGRDGALEELREIQMKDEKYRAHLEMWKGLGNKSIEERLEVTRKRREIVSRLLRENETYREADRKFNELKHTYWIEYLEHAINDFEERGFVFPLLWMLEL